MDDTKWTQQVVRTHVHMHVFVCVCAGIIIKDVVNLKRCGGQKRSWGKK